MSMENGWINESNEVYFVFTREDMQSMLRKSYNTVKKALDQLKAYGLIEEERQGLNKPNILYLTAVDYGNNEKTLETPLKSGLSKNESPYDPHRKRTLNFCESGGSKFESQEDQNLKPNKNNINKNNINQSINQHQPHLHNKTIDRIDTYHSLKNSDTSEYENYKQLLAKNIEYEHLKEKYGQDNLIDDILELMTDVMISTKKTERINGQNMPADIVKSTFMKLNQGHIEYLLESFNRTKTKASNIKAYLLTAIYNTGKTINAYYTNLVQYDMAK